MPEFRKALPEFVYYSMRRDGFFAWIMSDVKGMKMLRGKKDTLASYRIAVPPLEEQEQAVKQIRKIESKIRNNKKIMVASYEKRASIMKEYMK